MFNLQGSEIIIILLLALVVLGPEKLPDAMRKAGQFYAEIRKMSSGFQDEFRSAMDEPVREVRETANMLRDSADFTKLQEGSRTEKPVSAQMEPVADAEPALDAPPADAEPADAEPADDGESAERPASGATPVPPPPEPFAGSSTLGLGLRDESAPDETADDSSTTPPPPGATPVPPPPEPFAGSSTLGLGLTQSDESNGASVVGDESADPDAVTPDAAAPEAAATDDAWSPPDGTPRPNRPGQTATTDVEGASE